jgi:hypothetical protein
VAVLLWLHGGCIPVLVSDNRRDNHLILLASLSKTPDKQQEKAMKDPYKKKRTSVFENL